MIQKDIEKIRFLISLGADVNFCDSNRDSVLHLVTSGKIANGCIKNEIFFELVKVSYPLKLDVIDSGGSTSLAYALISRNRDVVRFLKEKGFSESLAQNCILLKELALAWGIECKTTMTQPDGKKVQVHLGGSLHHETGMEMLRESFQEFINVHKASLPGNIDLISQSFMSSEDPFKIFQRVRAGDYVLFSGGLHSHCISYVINKYQLMVSNRGLGRKAEAIALYQLNPSDCTQVLIQKLADHYDSIASFERMIKELHLVTENSGVKKKDQNAPNCLWASPKAALHGLLVECYPRNEAYRIYKMYTSFTRRYFLEKCPPMLLQAHPNLMNKIEAKRRHRITLKKN